MAAALLLSACGGSPEPATPQSDIPDEEMGEIVPSITIYSSLPEANMVNYEMAQEMAEELQKLGVDAVSEPMDFAVLLDVLYGDESDFDAYTIGWSGRIERLDPDMFIHSINHSANAEPGGNNTNRYRNPEFDELADAQRREMDLDETKRICI